MRNLWYRDSALWISSWIGITPHFVPSTFAHHWLTPTAVPGAIFYGLAGANHFLTIRSMRRFGYTWESAASYGSELHARPGEKRPSRCAHDNFKKIELKAAFSVAKHLIQEMRWRFAGGSGGFISGDRGWSAI